MPIGPWLYQVAQSQVCREAQFRIGDNIKVLSSRSMPKSLADLAEHDLIGFDHETPFIRSLVQRFSVFERSRMALRTDSNLVQLAAIRAGFGIGLCQVSIAERNPNMVRVLPQDIAIDLGVWIVMHEDLRTNAKCRAVFDTLVESLTET